jgi:hypothetical protein
MKTKLIILLLIVSSSLSYSQIIKGIGIKSGISLSNQDWVHSIYSYNRNFNLMPGIYEAITVDFISKKHWELSAEIGYYQSNSKNELNIYSINISEVAPGDNLCFGFISFSSVLKLKTQLKSFTPYLLLAPRLDCYTADFSNDNANYFKNDIQKSIWGFTIGEGVAYKIKNFSLFAEYQFLYSFNYLIDQPAVFQTALLERDRVKTNTHLISIGLKYHFVKE